MGEKEEIGERVKMWRRREDEGWREGREASGERDNGVRAPAGREAASHPGDVRPREGGGGGGVRDKAVTVEAGAATAAAGEPAAATAAARSAVAQATTIRAT